MAIRPVVFVSSTFYDLKHVRSELWTFIEEMGYTPLLSELPSFPIDPDAKTVESCTRAVADHADLFVLVVGARYGSLTPCDRSVTNLEYLAAVAKGIPIFAFVEQAILDVLPVWQKNREGDFTGTVDSPKLFEFIQSFRGGGERWVFGFRSSQEIKDALRLQWAALMRAGLQLRQRMRQSEFPRSAEHLNGEALRIAIEKPERWEFLLLGELMESGLAGAVDLERDLLYGLSDTPPVVTLDPRETFAWIRSQPALLLAFAAEIATITTKATKEAMGPPGEPGSVDEMVYSVGRFIALYRQALANALDCRRRVVPEDAKPAAEILGKAWTQLVFDVKGDGLKMANLANRVGRKETDNFEFTFTLREADFTGWDAALEKLRSLLE